MAVKFGALAGHGTRASIAPLRGRDEHWHHEYTLRKDHIDHIERHIALRAV